MPNSRPIAERHQGIDASEAERVDQVLQKLDHARSPMRRRLLLAETEIGLP